MSSPNREQNINIKCPEYICIQMNRTKIWLLSTLNYTRENSI